MSMIGKLLSLVLILSLITTQTSGLSYILEEGKQLCFIYDIPKDELMVGSFQSLPLSTDTPLADERGVSYAEDNSEKFDETKFGINVKIVGPKKDIVFENTYEKSSRFVFHSKEAGEHNLCFKTDSTSWFNPIKFVFDFEINTGTQAEDWGEIARKEHLDEIELRVRQLRDQAKHVKKEISYQKDRESRFRRTSDSNGNRLFYLSIVQLTIAIVCGLWQMKHLKTFFKKTKIY
eukprot:TRINITY_DN10295_c0_g1_i1.p1 TRINITY_DN10295_c0_g1~~TRINITY_DN10295_c0_g1_i1.p1  ORF type:complete len:233 (-),score=44.11 TRINITY_DN10295_c0_g1_i1:39-737(-)